VAGKPLDSDFRRFKVSNLAAQNNVGSCRKKPEVPRKIQADLMPPSSPLDDARQLEFDGVLRGHDVRVDSV